MADRKISELAEAASVASGDVITVSSPQVRVPKLPPCSRA